MNAFDTIHDVVKENFASLPPIPPFMYKLVTALNSAHLYYRIYKYEHFISKTADHSFDGHPAVYGAALHLFSEYTTIGAYAINVALVTKCAQDIFNEYKKLSDRYHKLLDAVEWRYPIYHQGYQPKNSAEKKILPPCFSSYVSIKLADVILQIIKIIRCTWEVIKQCFIISMTLCDAYLLLNGDPAARYEACTELVAGWDVYQSDLKNNVKKLLKQIQKSQLLADQILSRLQAKKPIDFIIKQLGKAIELVEQKQVGLLNAIIGAAEDVLNTIYIKGKIVLPNIDFTEGNNVPLMIPEGRFPPWGGHSVPVDMCSTNLNTCFSGLDEICCEN